MRIDVIEEIAGVEEEWDALADRVDASPFLRAGWIRAWWSAFGRGKLEIVTLRDGDELIAVMAQRRVAGAVVSPTNWHTPVFGPVARDAEASRELFGRLLATRPRQLAVSFLEEEDPARASLEQAADANGYRSVATTRLRSPYLDLPTDPDAVAQILNGKRRREMRRRRRQLEEQGEVQIDLAEEGGIEGLLEEGFRVESLGWKGERGTAIASDERTRRFYSDVARWAEGRGWMRFGFLRVGGKPVAFDFAFEQGGSLYLIKTGFDPARRAQAPGLELRLASITKAAADGCRHYEFLGQPEPTKLEWTDRCRHRVRVQAFRPSVGGTVDRWLWTHGRDAATRLRAAVRR